MLWIFFLTLCTVLIQVLHGAWGHQSFRIKAMTRGLDIDRASSPEVLGGESHDCYRKCVTGDTRTCFYSFTILEYTTMSDPCKNCPYTLNDCFNKGCITAGGAARHVTVANHMLPGPSIQVCEGDTIQVDVINTLPGESTAIHWHGLHQIGTPYMDGVPHLTQCPIHPQSSFKYNFTANPAGTHMWHSHNAYQEADGLYGSVVVRVADDPHSQYYDHDLSEHIMIIWHWFDSTSASVIKSVPQRRSPVRGYILTINGLAARVKYERDGVVHMTPRAEFNVTQGHRYRFRSMANTGIYCPIQVSIDNHTMLIIASDGASIEPVEVDTFIINAGERYDFVLKADREVNNYWIRYRGLGEVCSPPRASVTGAAILRYIGADDTANPLGNVYHNNSGRSGVLLNPVGESVENYSTNTLIHVGHLSGIESSHTNVSGLPDHIIYLRYNFNTYEELHPPLTHPQFNNRTFEFPPIPFLTQSDEITDDLYCTNKNDSAKDCFGNYCTCPYIYPVNVGSLVELVIIDETLLHVGNDHHPFHLHGQYFQIVAVEKGNGTITADDVKIRNEAGLIDKRFDRAPVKDTFGPPAHGFAVLRFVAINPGYWFFHCHVLDHLEDGMAIVIKTGEHSEMVKAPDDFPKCRNYDIA